MGVMDGDLSHGEQQEKLRQAYLDKYQDKGLSRDELLKAEGKSGDLSKAADRFDYVRNMNDALEKKGYIGSPNQGSSGSSSALGQRTATGGGGAAAGTHAASGLRSAESSAAHIGGAGASRGGSATALKDREHNAAASAAKPAGNKAGSPHAPGGIDRRGAPNQNKGPINKKFWFLGGGILGGVVMFFLVAAVILSMLGNLKDIHFATMLRSIGFARFSYVMRKDFARTIFDAAVLTDKSTGSAAKAMKGTNPPRQLRQLGTQGVLKFEFSNGVTGQNPVKDVWHQLRGTNQFKGIEVNGQRIMLDDIAKQQFGKTWAGLSIRERMTVRATYSDQVRLGVNDALRSESRFYRWKAFKNIRKVSGIRMVKWADKGRAYLGKSPTEARKLNIEETVKNVEGDGARPKSKLKQIQDDADDAREKATKAAINGESPGQVRSAWANKLRTVTKVSDAVFVTTAACIIHDLAESFDQMDKETEMRAMRLSHDALSAGGQVAEGETYAEAINANNSRWDNAEKSVLYKQATGDTKLTKNDQQQLSDIPSINGPTGTFRSVIGTIDDVIFPETIGGNAIDAILGAIGVEKSLNDIGCDALLNEYVQYSIAGTEIIISIGTAGATKGVVAAIKAAISGALVAVGTIGLGQLLGTLIDKAVASYAGMDYGGTQTGEPLFNQSMVGTNRLAQTGDRQTLYGRPLTDAETEDAQKVAIADLKQRIGERSFSYRYFAIENPFSLTGKLAAHTPSNFTDLGTMARSSLGSLASIFSTPQQLFSTIGNVLMPVQYANAAPEGNYLKAGDVSVWGRSNAEQKKIDSDPDFGVDELDQFYDNNKDDLEEKYGKCYSDALQNDIPKDCTADYLKTDEALKYRVYKNRMEMIEFSSGSIDGGGD